MLEKWTFEAIKQQFWPNNEIPNQAEDSGECSDLYESENVEDF